MDRAAHLMLRLFSKRPRSAHSSLPIYGSDAHLRICSKKKKKKKSGRIKKRKEKKKHTHTHTPRPNVSSCFVSEPTVNARMRAAAGLVAARLGSDRLCGGFAATKSSRPLQQLRIDGARRRRRGKRRRGREGEKKHTAPCLSQIHCARMMAFTFHSCSDRRGPPLVDAVRCSCESDPVVRSCPLNRLSPAKNHASQLGHVKQ